MMSLSREGEDLVLNDGTRDTRWRVIKDIHALTPDARSDRRSLDDNDEVPIAWAAPIERLNEPGKFWAFFPTLTTSLLSGISQRAVEDQRRQAESAPRGIQR